MLENYIISPRDEIFIMAILPVLCLFSGLSKLNTKRDLGRQLNKVFDTLSDKVKNNNSTTIAFEVSQESTEINGADNISFAQIQVTSTAQKEVIDNVSIEIQSVNNYIRYLILPYSVESGYNFDENEDLAKLRTEGVEAISEALFYATNGLILTTTNTDDLSLPQSPNDALKSLEYSHFSLLDSNLINGSSELLEELDEKVFSSEKSETGVIKIKATDHFLSGSDYTSVQDGRRCLMSEYKSMLQNTNLSLRS